MPSPRRSASFVPLLLLPFVAACDRETTKADWTVVVGTEAPEGVRIAADDVASYLEAMGESARVVRVRRGTYACRPGESRIVFGGDGVGTDPIPGTVTEQTFRHRSVRCDDGRFVRLDGGGLLGRQYAAYDWLRTLGVRFFHPEDEFVPASLAFPEGEVERTHTPPFRDRSVSLHLTHPLELGDAFRLGNEAYFEEARRYVDWQVKNLASAGTPGVGSGDLADYGLRRGFPRTTGLRLYGSQQGSTGIIDLDSTEPWQAQIDRAIEERMHPATGAPPTEMTVSFDPSEFTEVEDTVVVAQLTYIAERMAALYPDVRLDAIDHGTHGEPTPTYGIRYYDLPTLAPTNMGLVIHPLMFYDLFRPAPVYGNTDFHHFFDLMEAEYQRREITYFPEAAWWLTFDIAVPLYLPITVEARDRDLQGIRHMLDGKLVGHHVFGTGHEWGYWQNEYCSFRMAADLDVRWQDCFADITGTFGTAATEAQAVLEEAVTRQAEFMFDARAIRWLVGTDQETEAAALVGVSFHPLPPAPQEILHYDQAQIDAFRAVDEAWLDAIDLDFGGYVYRLEQVRSQVPAEALPFFDEIRDGLEMMSLRARHQKEVYGGLVRLRAARLAASQPLEDEAVAMLAAAAATTELAQQVIARREAGYRYAPLARSIAGGPNGGEDENWTTYAYRYLNRTHHAFYFRRIDALAAEALAGSGEVLEVDDAIVATAEAHTVRVLDPALASPQIAWGDGATSSSSPPFVHTYASNGAYDAEITGQQGGSPFAETIALAQVDAELHTGFTGTVIAPAGASLIGGLFPALVLGTLPGDRLALGFSANASHTVAPTLWVPLDLDLAAAVPTTLAADVYVPIVARTTGTVYTRIAVTDLVLTHDGATEVRMTGVLSTDSVIAAVVTVGNGAFDLPGARAIVAATLGYTEATLPSSLPFEVAYTLGP